MVPASRTINAAPPTFTTATPPKVSAAELSMALGLSALFVLLTRWPVMRPAPFETDEFGFLQTMQAYRWPMHHTLFLASARLIGQWVGDLYRGIVLLDMAVSALALVSLLWWLRALVRPATAVAATVVLGVAPVFWSYGAMAGNYTAIVLVGSFLLGVAVRSWNEPRRWYPFAAAAILAWGTAYRQDIGTLWLPVYFVGLWPYRWRVALYSLALFTALNLAWIGLMLHDVGGWQQYREASRDFAYHAGYLNSFWNLGVIDAPLRYAVKLIMALVWTLGPGLLIASRGLNRLVRTRQGAGLAALLALSMLPALGSHLFIHFGVPGYAFHYVPALMAMLALGIGRNSAPTAGRPLRDQAPLRLALLALLLASTFLFYPTDYQRPGFRGDFDLSFARHTRVGLVTPPPFREPATWRTANSPSVLSGSPRGN